ncbi:MAG: serpin family protein [Clostridia bacterium]|nr:serpin family protein [Clostridia bacterium]
MIIKRIKVIIVCALLLISLSVNLTGCVLKIQAEDLMRGIEAKHVSFSNDLKAGNVVATDFAIRLFNETYVNGKNTLISPLSVMTALAMAANGASGSTLEQMKTVLGGMSIEELNLYLYSYINSLPQGNKAKLSIANSIWFKDDADFKVNNEFLEINADYYGADIYKAAFDGTTLKDINKWVKHNTDGMIPKIIDNIGEYTLMYLINALAFEAEWTEIYEDSQVRDDIFTKEDGSTQTVDFMYSTEGLYLKDANATGFIKYYKGRKYAFVALLPNENITVGEFLQMLDGEGLNNLLSSPESTIVRTAIPKFEVEYSVNMSELLVNMGMTDAFDRNFADFTRLGVYENDNIYISEVIHKTYISLAEKGTKAGAATAIALDKCGSPEPEEIKTVYLDRPFVYMLIDCDNDVPFFIGVNTSIDKQPSALFG